MILQIPDRRQKLDYDCGTAALDSVCSFFGLRERGPVKLANAVQGMSPDTVEAVLRSLGLECLSGVMTLSDLKHLTATGRPVMCPVSLHGGHWTVVAGVERMRVHFQCPMDGPRALAARDWSAAWSDRSRTAPYHNWGIACSVANRAGSPPGSS